MGLTLITEKTLHSVSDNSKFTMRPPLMSLGATVILSQNNEYRWKWNISIS
jgi:hypothetical protein